MYRDEMKKRIDELEDALRQIVGVSSTGESSSFFLIQEIAKHALKLPPPKEEHV